MSERLPEFEQYGDRFEAERRRGLDEVCSQYLTADDVEVLAEMSDEADGIDYVFQRLMQEGYDPKELLAAYNVIEGENDA